MLSVVSELHLKVAQMWGPSPGSSLFRLCILSRSFFFQYGQNANATAPGSMPKTIGSIEEKGRKSKEEWSTDVTEYSCCQSPRRLCRWHGERED